MSLKRAGIIVGAIRPEQLFIMQLKAGYPAKAIEQLERVTNINYTDTFGKPLIHYAIESGHPSAVRAVAEHGADLNAPDATGITPLQLVLSYRAREEQQGFLLQMIQTLLDKGADPMRPGAEGQTPIDFLMSFTNTEEGDEYIEHVTRLFELYGQQILEQERIKAAKAAKTRALYPKGQKHKMNGGRQKMSFARFLPNGRKNMKTRRGLKKRTHTRR